MEGSPWELKKAMGITSPSWDFNSSDRKVFLPQFRVLMWSCSYQETPILLFESDLEAFSRTSFGPHQCLISGCFKSRLKDTRRRKIVYSPLIRWYFEFCPPIYLLLFTFQSFQKLLHAFCPGFIAAFSGKVRMKCVYSILPRIRILIIIL